MANPYQRLISECAEVMSHLVKLMCAVEDMKLFRNIAAVYIVWQHESHQLQLAAMEWKGPNG